MGDGYGVGTWMSDKNNQSQERRDSRGDTPPTDQLPWAVQVALQQWQEFIGRRSAGRQLTQADVDQLWLEFEQIDPTHAANARPLVRGAAASSSTVPTASGVTIVPTVA